MRKVFREDHEMFRDQVRRFVETEIAPHHAQWERDGIVPKSLWLRAGEEGLLCVTAPEAFGGAGGDFGHSAVLIEELARVNATAVGFTTHSDIAVPYLVNYGSEDQKARWLPRLISGELIAVIAMSEPQIGSDLRGMRTKARLEGDHYILSGQKTFITNGINSGLAIVAAKVEGQANPKDITLFCVEEGTPGFTKGAKFEKIGLRGQDTSELFFSDVRVPVENRLGEEGQGFACLMTELAKERLVIAIRAAASLEAMLDKTIAYTRERIVFGKPLLEFQNTRFKLADVKARTTMLRVFVDDCLQKLLDGELTPETAAMAKLTGAELHGQLLDELLQLHGGYGYMSEYDVGRAWVDARVARIYAGTSEIMKEIIARTL
ncbi:acyl-CoA dehydrogenase family protein [Brevundimonas sp. P7753]|jgi:acyl-CoA dehydrogenase|uniref:acyl-CoA dehydrogenase family protein n=1 Tax=Brevundimonas sp. P7753 TaxID=2726982 RepID=UPI0015B83D2E|nr:acyl-CoA dehydrogenase family protein [Brevundimonas sp. P7753]NWE52989.1 acyl-CoA dehydrogenase family protein [Brevundimonas sp. P7753]